jgi:hypothetical protein
MAKHFLPPSKEIIKRVRANFGLDDRGVKESVEMLKEWLQLQPHLPKVDGKYVNRTATDFRS